MSRILLEHLQDGFNTYIDQHRNEYASEQDVQDDLATLVFFSVSAILTALEGFHEDKGHNLADHIETVKIEMLNNFERAIQFISQQIINKPKGH